MARLPLPVKNSFPYFSNFCPMEKCHNFFDIHTDNFRKLIRYGYNLFLAIVGKKIRRPTLLRLSPVSFVKVFSFTRVLTEVSTTTNTRHLSLTYNTTITTRRRSVALYVQTIVLLSPNALRFNFTS